MEKVGADYLTEPFFIQADRRGRDRDDLPDYNVKITACLCFSRTFQMQEYYHNSSWLENGGSPEKAARSALTSALDAYIKSQGQIHQKRDRHQMARRAGLPRARDQLLLHANVLREPNEEGYQQPFHSAGHDGIFQRTLLTTYLIENKEAAGKIVEQVLINKRSRENAEKTRQSIKTNLQQKTDMANRVQKFIDCRFEG